MGYQPFGEFKESTLTPTPGRFPSLSAGLITLTEEMLLEAGSDLRSINFTSGSNGFQLLYDGTAEFNDITARGAIYASSGTLADLTVTGDLSVTGYVTVTTGTFRNNRPYPLGSVGYWVSIGGASSQINWYWNTGAATILMGGIGYSGGLYSTTAWGVPPGSAGSPGLTFNQGVAGTQGVYGGYNQVGLSAGGTSALLATSSAVSLYHNTTVSGTLTVTGALSCGSFSTSGSLQGSSVTSGVSSNGYFYGNYLQANGTLYLKSGGTTGLTFNGSNLSHWKVTYLSGSNNASIYTDSAGTLDIGNGSVYFNRMGATSLYRTNEYALSGEAHKNFFHGKKTPGLALVQTIPMRVWQYKEEKRRQKDSTYRWGAVVEDVEKALKKAGISVDEVSLVHEDEGLKFLQDGQLLPILWTAVQELAERVKELETSS